MTAMIRPSSMPRFIACPSSALPCDRPVDVPTEAAAMGNAVHRSLAAAVVGEHVDLDSVSREWGVDRAELGALHRNGLRIWDAVKHIFPDPVCEVPLRSTLTEGTADVVSEAGAAVLDWKSTRIETKDYSAQLAAYALCYAQTYGMGPRGEITTVIGWLRSGDYEVVKYDEASLEAFVDRVRDAESKVGTVYGPGEACSFCPRRNVCAAREEWVRSSSAALVPTSGAALTPAALGAVYDRIKVVERAAEEARKVLRDLASHGPVDIGDGRVLRLDETEHEVISPRAAVPVLVGEFGFSPADMDRVLSVSKSSITDIVGDRAPHGEKGKATSTVMDRLRAVGAVRVKTSTRMNARKKGG